MKLLDFTGRKVDPSLMMGFKEEKGEKDPNVKVDSPLYPYHYSHYCHCFRYIGHINHMSQWSSTPLRLHPKKNPKSQWNWKEKAHPCNYF